MKYQKEEHTPGLCLNKMFIYIHVKLNIFLRASFFFINYEFRWSIGYIYSRRNVCYSTVYARIGGPRYIPLFTTFWVRARKEHTCDLCIFQNAHLTQCAQQRKMHTSEWYNPCIIRQYIHSKTDENHVLFSN